MTAIHTETLLLVVSFLGLFVVVFGMAYAASTITAMFRTVASGKD